MKETTTVEPMPGDLPQAVHTALRRWHAGEQDDAPWRSMLLVTQRLGQQPLPDLGLALNEVLLQALNTLATQPGSGAARLLRLRFLDGLTAKATANRLDLTEDAVNKRQSRAIARLAGILWQAEQDARRARLSQIVSRIDVQQPARLFGVDGKLLHLQSVLASPGPPWLVAVVGIGGIGKTSLADAAVRALGAGPLFADIAWISARRERLTSWEGLRQTAEGMPALTIEELEDALLRQLDPDDLAQLPLAPRRAALRARLKAQPYLIVVDNLETAADYRALIPELQCLTNPTRFLLTSRHRLHDYPGVYNLSLDELSAEDSLALVRYEARERGLAALATASDAALSPLFDAAGGNPLALKLLIGQMHTLALPAVVQALRQARGQTVDELYRFIYWRSWKLLTDDGRRVLTIMPLVAESGGSLEQIAEISGLSPEPLTAALTQLVTLCLVNVQGTLEIRRYGVHRLTETFLLNEVIKW